MLKYWGVNDVFRAIAEPHRREILTLIRDREMSAGEIAGHFEVSRSAISQHLRILVEAKLVRVRSQGTSRYFRTDPEGLRELRHFVEDFWSSSLQRLKTEAEAEESSEHEQERGATR